MPRFVTAAALAAALMACAPAAMAQNAEREALWSDPLALRAAAGRPESVLLEGLLAAYEMRDAEAITALEAFLASGASDAEALQRARGTLAMVQLRQGLYAEARANLEQVLASFDGDASARTGLEQTLGVARTLSGAPAQRRGPFAAGSAPFERDMAGLPRVPLTINGQEREYVFDTGANFSVVTESQAAELGLEMLGETAGIGSVSQETTAARLALARTLAIGDLTFENVVFLVMPDASLSFAGGLYRIPGILGFPVISAMERVSVGRDTVSWGPSAAAADRDLFVDGLTPRVYGRIEEGPPVQFALDTGANRTGLRPIVLEEQPRLADGAETREERVGGAGGVQTVSARVVPVVVLHFDAVAVVLENVSVATESAGGDDIHGRLGQDVLSRGYVMDFRAGDFALMAGD